MRPPLFRVGEECYLCSSDFPEHNGKAVVVTDCEYRELWRIFSGTTDGYGYWITPDPVCPVKPWRESALRKKYPPGDSFETLMRELKKPVKKGVMV